LRKVAVAEQVSEQLSSEDDAPGADECNGHHVFILCGPEHSDNFLLEIG
jgi:hypothetical protein